MISLRFTDKDWERIERDTMAWWAGELDRPLVWLSASDPLPQAIPYRYLSNYPLDMPTEELVNLYEPALAATRFYGDAFPYQWINFGPGIMAGFVGSGVHSVSDPQETVWFSAPSKVEIEDLDLAYDARNAWWKRVQELTVAFVRCWDGQVGSCSSSSTPTPISQTPKKREHIWTCWRKRISHSTRPDRFWS